MNLYASSLELWRVRADAVFQSKFAYPWVPSDYTNLDIAMSTVIIPFALREGYAKITPSRTRWSVSKLRNCSKPSSPLIVLGVLWPFWGVLVAPPLLGCMHIQSATQRDSGTLPEEEWCEPRPRSLSNMAEIASRSPEPL